jgi:hypothetical protein
MHFASGTHLGTHSLRRFAIPLTVILALGTLLTGSFIAITGHASASGSPSYHASARTLTAAGRSGSLTQATASSGRSASLARGARGLRANHSTAPRAAQVGHVPSAASSSLDSHQTSPLLSNFDGVGSRDSGVTNFGAEFEPPDQGLCVGNGFVVEPVNSAYSIFRTNGKRVAGPFNVNVLFDEGLTEFTSDPRCYFDKATNTWFAVILFIATTPDGNFGNNARTDIAVNTSGDPTTPWTVYHLDATDDGANGTPSHPGCPCFGDQPRLGIDSQNLYFSTDEFSILGPEFNGTQIYAVSKSNLVQHASTIHFVQFDNLSMAGDVAFGVQPAITNGSADAEYFFNSLDPNFSTDNRLGVWALTGGDTVSQGGTPTLSSIVIQSETYGVPPAAIQKGSSSTLDSGDDRMQEVQFIGGNLWGALDTVLTPQGDTTVRAGIAWFKVGPHLNGKKIGSANVRAQGYVASLGNYLLYPSIQANGQGSAALVMTLTGSGNFASAAYALMHNGAFDTVKVAASGSGPYDPNATRWGDYSWAVLDPDHDSFWMAIEYMPPKSSQTKDGRRNWGTRVIDVAAEN